MTKDHLMTFRVESWLHDQLMAFQAERRIHNSSFAYRQALKLGLQAHALIVGRTTNFVGDNLEIYTAIDAMTTEQKEKLLERLKDDLGMKEVGRLRSLAKLK